MGWRLGYVASSSVWTGADGDAAVSMSAPVNRLTALIFMIPSNNTNHTPWNGRLNEDIEDQNGFVVLKRGVLWGLGQGRLSAGTTGSSFFHPRTNGVANVER